MTVIIFTRVSTLNQANENYSLEIQEKMCREYLKNHLKVERVEMILNNVGSGFKVGEDLNRKYDFIMNAKQPFVVCISVDRFSRNFEKGQKVYNSIIQKEGRIVFLLDGIDSNNEDGEKNFLEKLRFSEQESKTKSDRTKIAGKFFLNMRIMESQQELHPVSEFVRLIRKGGKVEEIYSKFRQIVNWEAHPEWVQEGLYNNPIEFDNSFTRDGESWIHKDDVSYRSIANILKDYEVKIPITGIRNKVWSEKLVQKINEVNNPEMLLEILEL
jgi:hypothetical protein